MGKVAIQKDILDKQLGEEDLSEGEKRQVEIELGIINKRLGNQSKCKLRQIEEAFIGFSRVGRDSGGSTDRLGI